MEWLLLMIPAIQNKYESVNGNTGMYRAQNLRIILVGRSLRKFLTWCFILFCFLYKTLQILILLGKVSEWRKQIHLCKRCWMILKDKNRQTSCSIFAWEYFLCLKVVKYWILGIDEESLSLETLKTWMHKALSCWNWFQHVVKLETSRGFLGSCLVLQFWNFLET